MPFRREVDFPQKSSRVVFVTNNAILVSNIAFYNDDTRIEHSNWL